MTGHQRKRSIFPKHEGEGISARSSGFDRGALSLLVKVAGTSPEWGWLPGIAVLQSTALLLLAVAFAGARADVPLSDFLFWISLALLIFPAAFRLASAEPARRERIGLILLLGMSLYFVKVMYSPVAFTFPDELSHMRNVNEILETHRLFQENPVQPVTAFYPGLPTVTSTLVTLSGLPVFPAGLLVIGIARLILFLALFLLFEQISGSPQVAGLAVLLYMANPNALYWTSEYAYEALALPLATLVLLGVAKRETATDGRHRMAWTTVALLGLLTVAITHHMTSYFLTGVLLALTIFSAVRSRGTQWGPWSLALIAVIVNSLWLLFFANPTIKYLSFIFWDATRSALNLIGAQGQLRELHVRDRPYHAPPVTIAPGPITIGTVVISKIDSSDPFTIRRSGSALAALARPQAQGRRGRGPIVSRGARHRADHAAARHAHPKARRAQVRNCSPSKRPDVRQHSRYLKYACAPSG